MLPPNQFSPWWSGIPPQQFAHYPECALLESVATKEGASVLPVILVKEVDVEEEMPAMIDQSGKGQDQLESGQAAKHVWEEWQLSTPLKR
jgi:hypothetical protein